MGLMRCVPLFLLFFCFSFFNCIPQRITIGVDSDAAAFFDRWLQDFPLPADLEYVRVHGEQGTIRLLSRGYGENSGEVPGRLSRIVGRTWSARTSDLLRRMHAGEREMPLESIRLPQTVRISESAEAKAMLFPAKEFFLSIDADAPGPLLSWFETIPTAAADPITWISAVGDIMPGRGVDEVLVSGQEGPQIVFGNTLPLLANADFLIGNLEAAATAHEEPFQKAFMFRFRPEALAKLAESGFDYLMLANNHTYDFQLPGFIDTLSHATRYGLRYSGAGLNREEAMAPFRATVNGTKLNVVSFGAYPSEVPLDRIRATETGPGVLLEADGLAVLKMTSGPETFDIAVVHAGKEYADMPDASVRRLFRKCIDEGADLVLGTHPHVLQGLEVYRGKLIAYSLGNFIFPGMSGFPNATDSMILRIGVHDNAIVIAKPVFVKLEGLGVRLADTEDRRARERFHRLCASLAVD